VMVVCTIAEGPDPFLSPGLAGEDVSFSQEVVNTRRDRVAAMQEITRIIFMLSTCRRLDLMPS